MELDLRNVVSLMVYLPEYSDAAQVAQVLEANFGKRPDAVRPRLSWASRVSKAAAESGSML